MKAVGLLAGGKANELPALFSNPSQVAEPLQRLAERLGKVLNISEVLDPRFSRHQRTSIQLQAMPSSYAYRGYWINARSETLGDVQFHIARAPESACKLLAFHIDNAQ